MIKKSDMLRDKIFNFYLNNNTDKEIIKVSTLKNNSLYKLIVKEELSEVWFFATKKDGNILKRGCCINRLCSLMLNSSYEEFYNKYGNTVYFREDDEDFKLYKMKPIELIYLTKLQSEEAKRFCQEVSKNKVYLTF